MAPPDVLGTTILHETAKREEIPFTIAASARGTGTDADVVHLSRAGIPTGGVSITMWS